MALAGSVGRMIGSRQVAYSLSVLVQVTAFELQGSVACGVEALNTWKIGLRSQVIRSQERTDLLIHPIVSMYLDSYYPI